MKIEELIKLGKLKEAILKLEESHLNDAAILLGRLNSLNKGVNMGIIPNSKAHLEKRQIINKILEINGKENN